MVNGQVWVLAGATGACPAPRTATCFPDVNATAKALTPQLGHQRTAGNSSPDYGKGWILRGCDHS